MQPDQQGEWKWGCLLATILIIGLAALVVQNFALFGLATAGYIVTAILSKRDERRKQQKQEKSIDTHDEQRAQPSNSSRAALADTGELPREGQAPALPAGIQTGDGPVDEPASAQSHEPKVTFAVPEATLRLLKESIPNRFMNVSPHQFEEFVGQLFRDAGYHVELTKRTGDFGADLLVRKGSASSPSPVVAVQVKRYNQDRTVGVKDINQAIGAKEFYGCEKVIVITTSSFSKPGMELAQKALVDLWDWDRLYREIMAVYFGGQDIYEVFGGSSDLAGDVMVGNVGRFSFKVERIDENSLLTDKNYATVLHMKMKNETGSKIDLKLCSMPVIIDTLGNQFDAYTRITGCFWQGSIYPRSSVPLSFGWFAWQIPKGSALSRIILRYSESPFVEIQEVILDKDGKVYETSLVGPRQAPSAETSTAPPQPPEPQHFTGHGQQVSPLFRLAEGLAIFRITHDGEKYFSIWLMDSQGNRVDLLANMSGKFEGSKGVGIGTGGFYVLNIEADGNWTVTVEQAGVPQQHS